MGRLVGEKAFIFGGCRVEGVHICVLKIASITSKFIFEGGVILDDFIDESEKLVACHSGSGHFGDHGCSWVLDDGRCLWGAENHLHIRSFVAVFVWGSRSPRDNAVILEYSQYSCKADEKHAKSAGK